MATAGGQIGEPDVVELAISMLCPSIDDGGGGGDQPKNKCVCVIGSNVNRFPDLEGEEEEEGDSSKGTGRWWVQFFIGDGYSMSSIMDIASSGVALDFESISVDRTGIMAVHKPFKQVKMDVDRCSFTFVAAPDGSPTIYCLGGFVRKEGPWEEYLLSRDVRIFDFNTATITYGPSMEAPRVRPVVLVLDGKIYVFGGVTHNNPAVSWAESLDIITTNSNTDAHPWKLLHPPPVFPSCHGTFALGVDDGENIFFGGEGGGKAILLGSTGEQIFLVYHVAEDRWIQFPDRIPIPSWSSWPVVVGHTLYWFGDCFCAYDLRTHQLCGGLVRGLGDDLPNYIMGNEPQYSYKPGLHHLGGDDFCLTWLDWVNIISCTFTRLHSTVTRLHSTVIRVVMSKDGFHFLDAFVVTSFGQLLPQGFYLDRSLLLDGLVYNHTVVKEGLTSESLIPLEMIVKENAEAGIDHEGAAKGKIEDNADHEAAAKQKIEDNADHEAAAKEKIEENAGIGLQVLLTPKERRSPGLLLR